MRMDLHRYYVAFGDANPAQQTTKEKHFHLCGWITIVIQPLYPHSQNPRFAKLSATASAVASAFCSSGGWVAHTNLDSVLR
jgi:hypothetical protein